MQIAEFQEWTKDTDKDTQWDLITTPQLISHLAEEVGEVAQSVNRICRYTEDKERHLANLGLELVEAFWFLTKIANRFAIDLEAEAAQFVNSADEWAGKHCANLIGGLRALDRELAAARKALNLKAR